MQAAREQVDKSRTHAYTPFAVESEKELKKTTGQLYDLLFAPLVATLSEKRDVIISPDGQLNLLPFEILPCSDSEYAVEKYKISYVSSGRDLLKFQRQRDHSNWSLVMAAPDFNASGEEPSPQSGTLVAQSLDLNYVPGRSRGASECLTQTFNPIPYSVQEANSIMARLRLYPGMEVHYLSGGEAMEEVLKRLDRSPRILHLATHGFFCEDLDCQDDTCLENPLLRSGLALAGANLSRPGKKPGGKIDAPTGEDGLLTAFEVSGLSLENTELVVLSACETGVGEVKNGEGVYGLRRSFLHAGSQTILMSLWKVPDKETAELMDRFYRYWGEGYSKKEALRLAELDLLQAHQREHGHGLPFFWGAFVVLGDSG